MMLSIITTTTTVTNMAITMVTIMNTSMAITMITTMTMTMTTVTTTTMITSMAITMTTIITMVTLTTTPPWLTSKPLSTLIAEAESHAHGMPVTEIHFHEVGSMDAIADITAVCCLVRAIAPDRIVVSPIHVGSGHVHCAHGILPVPAPATAYILRDVPIYGGRVRGELCTPTGAALLRHFANEFGDMPVMSVKAIGYGMGAKDFEEANCVRVMLGDEIVELDCNIDDMTGEELGYAFEKLFTAGARDVFSTPITMKKNRPGILLSVLCAPSEKASIIRAIFRYTTTIGVREKPLRRYVLDRSEDIVLAEGVYVRRKEVSGYGVARSKYEFDDLRKIADAKGISLREAAALVEEKQ